jgi:hypothetical protein
LWQSLEYSHAPWQSYSSNYLVFFKLYLPS